MRFWDKVKAVGKAVVSGVSTAISERSISAGVSAGVNTYCQELKHKKTIIIKDPSNPRESDYEHEQRRQREEEERKEQLRLQRLRDDAARKAIQAKRQEMIDAFHENHVARANMFETNARRIYEETYENIIEDLSAIFDVNPIRNFIVEKSKTFRNVVKYEVNRKVSLGNKKMTSIMDDETLSLDEYENKLNLYVDTVFNDARKNLLDLIDKAVKETNEYIRSNAEKFLNDEVEVVTTTNNKLKELAKKGAARDAELRTIAEEQATLSFINSLASEIK